MKIDTPSYVSRYPATPSHSISSPSGNPSGTRSNSRSTDIPANIKGQTL